ncbi:hypothetical protein D3C73_1082030 [compost metagenome]
MIHCGIRFFDHSCRIYFSPLTHADPYTTRNRNIFTLNIIRSTNIIQDQPRKDFYLVRIKIFHDEQKFIAAYSISELIFVRDLLQMLADLPQQLISCLMSIRIVNFFELIKVKTKQGQIFFFLVIGPEVLEPIAIQQSSDRITISQLIQLDPICPQLPNIESSANQQCNYNPPECVHVNWTCKCHHSSPTKSYFCC